MADWYYLANGQQVGPIQDEELLAFAANGEIQPDTMLWCEGMDNWLPAADMIEFDAAPEPEPEPEPEPAPAPAAAPPPPPGGATEPWHYLAGGEQQGPVSFEELGHLYKSRELSSECLVWSQSLGDWKPAADVPALAAFKPVGLAMPTARTAKPATTKAPKAKKAAGGKKTVIRKSGKKTLVKKSGKGTVVRTSKPKSSKPKARSPYSAPESDLEEEEGEQVGNIRVKPVKYLFIILPMILGLVAYSISAVVFVMWSKGVADAVMQAAMNNQPPPPVGGPPVLAILLYFLGIAFLLTASIYTLIVVYRAWTVVNLGGGPARTTPGKAIGFLFIPFFNLYWMFVAIYGLAQDYNQLASRVRNAPRMSDSLWLWTMILGFVPCVNFVAIFLWFVVYKQMCDGVNFFARRRV